MRDTVLSTVDDEAVQVLVIPAESHLKGGVQVGDGAVTAHEQASPDQRADGAQDDAQLVNNGFGGRFRFRHPVMVSRHLTRASHGFSHSPVPGP